MRSRNTRSGRSTRTFFLEELEGRIVLATPPGSLPPIISGFPQEVVAPGGQSQPLPFFVSDPQGDLVEVTAAVSNANPAGALSNTDIVLSGLHDTRTVQIFDTEDVIGTATVTLTAYTPATRLRAQTSFTVALDIAPTVSLPQGYSYSQPAGQFPLTIPVTASSPESLPLTRTATASFSSLLYNEDQQYLFTGVGYFTAGAPAYVLHSVVSGPGVAGYYLLRPSDGALFPYDGSGTYDNTLSGTPIATLGANVYADPTLLLNAQPPADYVTLQALEQQYQFTGVGYFVAGAGAYVLQSPVAGPGVGGYYLIRPSDGALFAYDGSGNYYHTFTNNTPLATLGSNLYNFPDELTDAQASPTLYSQLYQVEQQLDLQELNGSYYTNTYGNQAEWLYSPVANQYGEHWYTLILSNNQSVLTAWEGYQDSSVGAVVATFNTAAVYDTPSLLTTAKFAPEPPAGTASIDNSGNLVVNLPSSGYVGTFQATVNVSDGVATTSQTVTVTDTDTAPTITVTSGSTPIPQGGNQTLVAGGFPVSDTVTTTDVDGGTVTASASVASYSMPYSLQQQYQFTGLGYFTASSTAYVLTAANNNAFGNPYYLLSTTGGLYAYDGSGSYAHTFANVTPLANLGAGFYDDPTQLTNAQAPTNYTNLYTAQQQYQFTGLGYFTAGATAYVLHSNASGAGFEGYYLLTANGTLYAYDGSGSYAHTIANSANVVASFEPAVYANPSLLLGARAAPALYSQLAQDELQYDMQEFQGSFYTGLRGNGAKWLYSLVPNQYGQHWYTLVLANGGSQTLLYAWDGGNSSIPAGGTPLDTYDSSVYADPTLLLDAKSPAAASGVTAMLSGGTLTLNAPTSFAGTFQVTVTATDGSLTTTQTFQVTATDPTPAAIIDPAAAQAAVALLTTPGTGDVGNDPVTHLPDPGSGFVA
jgi:hypothetical protein